MLREYIIFCLIGDDFAISHKLRELSKDIGMYDTFELCEYIADKFAEFDEDHQYYGEYDSLVKFLDEYAEEIENFIDNDTPFKVKIDCEQILVDTINILSTQKYTHELYKDDMIKNLRRVIKELNND